MINCFQSLLSNSIQLAPLHQGERDRHQKVAQPDTAEQLYVLDWGLVFRARPPGHLPETKGAAAAVRGTAVQVVPIKHMLIAPGIKRLKLKYDNLLSSFAFKFKLRRYIEPVHVIRAKIRAAAGPVVRRCRLTQ